jgi:hypothetical protein
MPTRRSKRKLIHNSKLSPFEYELSSLRSPPLKSKRKDYNPYEYYNEWDIPIKEEALDDDQKSKSADSKHERRGQSGDDSNSSIQDDDLS